MMHEVRSIPPAPRRIRLRPLFAHRWPLAVTGLLALLGGALVAWLMFLQSGGKPSDQERLERGPVTVLRGRVRDLSAHEGLPRQQADYEFDWNGETFGGKASVATGSFAVGQDVEIRVLTEQPTINCVLGGVLFVDRVWLRPAFWLGVLAAPGAGLLVVWLAGFVVLRRVLEHGDATVGRVVGIHEVVLVVPEMLHVTYEFRDHRAVLRVGSHWVRMRGDLGARLLQQQRAGRFESLPVLHDRAVPRWNRLILPVDFLASPAHGAVPANGNA